MQISTIWILASRLLGALALSVAVVAIGRSCLTSEKPAADRPMPAPCRGGVLCAADDCMVPVGNSVETSRRRTPGSGPHDPDDPATPVAAGCRDVSPSEARTSRRRSAVER